MLEKRRRYEQKQGDNILTHGAHAAFHHRREKFSRELQVL